MDRNFQPSWRFKGVCVLVFLTLLSMVSAKRLRLSKKYGSYGSYGGSYGGQSSGFQATDWVYAHATFYGDDSPSSTMGGACGYGTVSNYNGYGTNTAALSTSLFNNGFACGSCYQIKCVESQWCYGGSPTITVTATNLCPPNWYQDSNNGGWCNPPRQHFDLTKPAFTQLAVYTAGIIPVQYRRVPCAVQGGIQFSFQGNPYWLWVYVLNVGGAGDVCEMWVKGTNTDWISMAHNWGASYQAFACLGGQELSFKLKSTTTGQVIVAYNVAPAYWTNGQTYQANVNFQ